MRKPFWPFSFFFMVVFWLTGFFRFAKVCGFCFFDFALLGLVFFLFLALAEHFPANLNLLHYGLPLILNSLCPEKVFVFFRKPGDLRKFPGCARKHCCRSDSTDGKSCFVLLFSFYQLLFRGASLLVYDQHSLGKIQRKIIVCAVVYTLTLEKKLQHEFSWLTCPNISLTQEYSVRWTDIMFCACILRWCLLCDLTLAWCLWIVVEKLLTPPRGGESNTV